MSPAPAGDAPYLHDASYWVPAEQAGEYPVRQGDLFGGVQVGDDRCDAVMIVHPTCELGKKSVAEIQVARVRALDDLADDKQRRQVVAGIAEIGGVLRIAFAHTFFLAPVLGSGLDEPMWANLREIGSAPREQLTAEQRVGAPTHDARVTLIRRYLTSQR